MKGFNSRNSPCSCGSNRRFKDCCGAPGSIKADDPEIADAKLLAALKRADDAHLAEGIGPSARSLMNVGKALESFGISTVLLGTDIPPIVERTRKLGNQLFVPKELQLGGMHLGAYLYRDMFCRLYVPISFGQVAIDFFELIELNDVQRRWIAESPDELARFTDQAADLLDFGYGWQEFGHGRQFTPRSKDLIWRAHTQLEAAAATATSAYDFRGTVQSALLGAELALKAGLAAHGVADLELRRAIGHNIAAATDRLATFEPALDVARIKRVITRFPDFIESRYDAPPPSRIETGHILMGAQYIASEVTRRFSQRDCRTNNPTAPPRAYPA
jgi:hypothetical protein